MGSGVGIGGWDRGLDTGFESADSAVGTEGWEWGGVIWGCDRWGGLMIVLKKAFDGVRGVAMGARTNLASSKNVPIKTEKAPHMERKVAKRPP